MRLSNDWLGEYHSTTKKLEVSGYDLSMTTLKTQRDQAYTMLDEELGSDDPNPKAVFALEERIRVVEKLLNDAETQEFSTPKRVRKEN